MKKVLFLLMFPVMCFGQYTSIPDQNFEQALIDFGYDDVIDRKVLTMNIDTLKKLDVRKKNISDLTGIEDFTALTYLDYHSNKLTNLDLSGYTALTYLKCHNNQITNLDVSKNTALTGLYCGSNKLTSLDVSQNTALTGFSCYNNQITNLDVSQNTALEELDCESNQLTKLDVSRCTALLYLSCGGNKFDCDSLIAKFRLNKIRD